MKEFELRSLYGCPGSYTAVDFYGDLYNPLYIELEEGGERVRVYEVRRA